MFRVRISVGKINKLRHISLERGIRTWSWMNSNPANPTRGSFHEHARTEIERVYIFFLSRPVPGAKHFLTEQPSLWVCAFVRGSARTIVQSPNVHPPSKKKGRKFTGRWHEKMGRKGLNCDAANATLHAGKRAGNTSLSSLFVTTLVHSSGSTTVLHLCHSSLPLWRFTLFSRSLSSLGKINFTDAAAITHGYMSTLWRT